jgi:hypothetical protein
MTVIVCCPLEHARTNRVKRTARPVGCLLALTIACGAEPAPQPLAEPLRTAPLAPVARIETWKHARKASLNLVPSAAPNANRGKK